MRKALVCDHCFDLTWFDSETVGRGPRSWWTCTKCVPLGGFEGEY